MTPYLLPKMHDRYFLAADLCSIVLAFVVPRLWWVPVSLQIGSGLAYVPIVSDAVSGYGWEYTGLMPLAVAIMTAYIAALGIVYWRGTRPDGPAPGESAAGSDPDTLPSP